VTGNYLRSAEGVYLLVQGDMRVGWWRWEGVKGECREMLALGMVLG